MSQHTPVVPKLPVCPGARWEVERRPGARGGGDVKGTGTQPEGGKLPWPPHRGHWSLVEPPGQAGHLASNTALRGEGSQTLPPAHPGSGVHLSSPRSLPPGHTFLTSHRVLLTVFRPLHTSENSSGGQGIISRGVATASRMCAESLLLHYCSLHNLCLCR